MLTWPIEINPPDPSGYALTPADVTQRTKMSQGYVRSRRVSINNPTGLTAKFLVGGEEEELIRSFYKVALRQGADAFLMPVWTGQAFHEQQVVFNAPPKSDYHSWQMWTVSADFTIINDLGPCIWKELTLTDKDTEVDISLVQDDFRISRVDIFVRVPPDSENTDTLRIGITGDGEAFVKDVDVSSAGTIHVKLSHEKKGDQLGVLQTAAHTVTAKWKSNAGAAGDEPTQCDIAIIIPYSLT